MSHTGSNDKYINIPPKDNREALRERIIEITSKLGVGSPQEDTEAIMKAVDEYIGVGDAFDFVEPCEPDCTPERHAYHQGQWDMAVRITGRPNPLREKTSNG